MKYFITIIIAMLIGSAIEAKTINSQYAFIENKGQIIDQHNHLNPAVKYLWNGGTLKVQLKTNSFSYEVLKWVGKSREEIIIDMYQDGKHWSSKNDSMHDLFMQDDTLYSHRVDVELVGANLHPQIIAEGQSSDYLNYYTTGTPEEGVTEVRSYSKVTYKNIYPNIDLEFIINNQSTHSNHPFKYNFIVHPGGSVADIRLRYQGAEQVFLEHGKLEIQTAYGLLDESIPLSFDHETGQEVAVHYQMETANTISFQAGSYNSDHTLIIDPWATYYGGTGSDEAYGVAADLVGNYIMCGGTNSASNIATSGAYQSVFAGNADAFVVKFSPSGARLWCTYYGGSNLDVAFDVSVDVADRIVISGQASSTTNIATSGAYQTTKQGIGGPNAFIARFNNAGFLLWGTYYGGTGSQICRGVATDGQGNIAITGGTQNGTGITTVGAHQTVYGGGGQDAFIAKFDSSGAILWSTFYGGANNTGSFAANHDIGFSIAFDALGNVYVSGSTDAPNNIATTGAFLSTNNPNFYETAFLVKFNTSGVRQWGTYYGDIEEIAYGVATDASGNVVMAGYTASQNNIASAGAYQTTYLGGKMVFIAKFSSSGTRLWGTYYGPASNSSALDVATDNSGNIFMVGSSNASTGMATPGAYQTSFSGGNCDFILAKFSSAGGLLWSTYYGGPSNEGVARVCIDAAGNIAIAGYTSSSSNIATPGAYQTAISNGNHEAFLAVFSPSGSLSPTNSPVAGNTISGSQNACSNAAPAALTGALPYGGNGTYQYLWLQSTTSAATGFSAAIGTNNTQNYQPPVLSATTWYKRVVNSGTATDTTAAVQVTLNQAPTVIVAAAGPTTFCEGGNVQLNATATSSVSIYYQWQVISNVNIAGATNSSYTAQFTNQYRVIVTDANNCQATTPYLTVVANIAPSSTFSPGGPLSFCQGNNVTLNSNNIAGVAYQWMLNGIAIGGATTPNYTAIQSGAYQLIASANGCSDTAAATTVTVKPLPATVITVNGSNTLCAGDSVVLNTPIGAGYTYQWQQGSTNINAATNSNYTVYNSGNYKVIVSAAGCDSTAPSVSITVNSLPVVAISETALTLSATGSYTSYQWYLNGNPITGATNPTYTATQNGGYYLVVTDANNCTGQSNTLQVTDVGIRNIEGNHCAVYPNPATDEIKVILTHARGNLRFTDVVGKVIKTITVKTQEINIDLEGLSSGIYLLQYDDGEVCETVKVEKE